MIIPENSIIGQSIRHLPVVDSTNSQLKAEGEAGLFGEGAVLVADYQTAGRGRFDRQWLSPPGKALLFSVLLKPRIDPGYLQLISFIASLAVLDGLENRLQSEKRYPVGNKVIGCDEIAFSLKWPNDILIDGKKICGILCESGVDKEGERFVVIGIGLNVNQSESDFPIDLQDCVTSLYIKTVRTQPREKLLGLILKQLEVYYLRLQGYGFGWITAAWWDRAGLDGKVITVTERLQSITGECIGLNREGALIIRKTDGRLHRIYSGDVS